MSKVDVREYDDEGIIEDCEVGWRRFCAETLVRTHYHIKQLCRQHRKRGMGLTRIKGRKAREVLRRQVAAYRWVFEGTGGSFSFASVCLDVGLCPDLVRREVLSLCRPAPDINLLVGWVARQKERVHDARGKDSPTGGVVPSVRDAVRDFRRNDHERQGRRGAQTHAVCRYKDSDAY